MKRVFNRKRSSETIRRFWGECVCYSHSCYCSGPGFTDLAGSKVRNSWQITMQYSNQFGGPGPV